MIGIIGAGASGMAAAIAAARLGADVTVLERGPRVGRKLLVTGNGRCNITNRFASADKYSSASPNTLKKMLSNTTVEEIRQFFDSLGLPLREEEEGRFYPRCNLAGAVVDCLRLSMAELGVELRTDCAVASVKSKKRGFEVSLISGESLYFDNIIVAAGGQAAEKNGGTRDGVNILRALGHQIQPIGPALSPLCTETEPIRSLRGIRAACAVSALSSGTLLRRELGEVLFAEFGISGIAAMQLSTAISRAKGPVTLCLDFFPDLDEAELRDCLLWRRDAFPRRPLPDWLAGLMHRRIAEVLYKRCGFPLSKMSGSLKDAEISALAASMKCFSLPCTGVKPLSFAQATAGGANLDEFDPATMESRLVSGLYAAGEVLDAVGDCGGFNLHWAWVTGITAGRSCACCE
ncbi:MAG: NAD(P)/FAD-dependent oxidoreductase [Christensenellales bacterium]|jgi:predicted Rossmann fold flavoprotein